MQKRGMTLLQNMPFLLSRWKPRSNVWRDYAVMRVKALEFFFVAFAMEH